MATSVAAESTEVAKAKQDKVPAHILKQLKEAFAHGKETRRTRTR